MHYNYDSFEFYLTKTSDQLFRRPILSSFGRICNECMNRSVNMTLEIFESGFRPQKIKHFVSFMNASILREPPYSGKKNLQSVYSVETKRERKHRPSFDDRIHTSHAYH